MEKKESMGAIIRRLRTEKGWTQETLAERLHLTAQAVSRWETEQSLPDVSQLPLLARALGVTTDTLYGMDEPEEDDLILNANMVYVPWDTERAIKHWERMAEHLRAGDPGPESSNFRWTFLSLSVNLTDPESPIYVPERAGDIRAAALSLGRIVDEGGTARVGFPGKEVRPAAFRQRHVHVEGGHQQAVTQHVFVERLVKARVSLIGQAEGPGDGQSALVRLMGGGVNVGK